MLDGYEELTPVEYGDCAIKYLHCRAEAGKMCFHLHWHDRMELICVISGTLMLYSDEGHLPILPGQIAVFPPCRRHGAIAGNSGVEYHTVMFDVEKFCNHTAASQKYLLPIIKGEAAYPATVDDTRLRNTFEKLAALVEGETRYHPLQAEAMVYEIIGLLGQYRIAAVKNPVKATEGFLAILDYVNAHFTEKMTARELSARFGYNEAYFGRRFREVTGLNFTKYVQTLRMEYAAKLLRRGKDDIRCIAWKSGYSDVSYFSNSFKKHYGFRPSEIYGRNELGKFGGIGVTGTEVFL